MPSVRKLDLDVNNRLLNFSPPTNYPISELVPPNNKLQPIVITYEVMKTAVTKAHDKLSSGTWTTDNATAYLRVNGLNKEDRTEVIIRATNVRTYNDSPQQLSDDDEGFQALQRLRIQDPSAFEFWKFPALWSHSTMLSQHVDAIMHLLFLGVIKTTIKHIEG
jgi:ABC-type histidine transport system ATPase subunit